MRKVVLDMIITAYMAVIFILSVIKMPGAASRVEGLDKVFHFAAYGIMGFLWAGDIFISAIPARYKTPRAAVALVFLVTFSYGGFIEICQSFIPWRSMELADAVANGLGGLAGAVVFQAWGKTVCRKLFPIADASKEG